MIRMSTRFRYGLCAAVELVARNAWVGARGGPVSIALVAKAQRIPDPYLRQIFHALKRAGLVTAAMGKRGGYRLARAPRCLTALDVAEALGERIVPVPCGAGRVTGCRHRGCGTRELWRRVAGVILRVLEGTTIANLAVRRAAPCSAARPSRGA